jgi:large subunit ribosomal protein L25
VPEVKLTAELRTEFGKGAARRIRRAHKVPAVLYGHGTDPIHISLPGHETLLALRTANALLSIEVNGSSPAGVAQTGPARSAETHHRARRSGHRAAW